MNKSAMFFALAILIVTMTTPTSAGPPTAAFTYQGKLTDSDGQPLTGSYSMSFTLFDSAIDGKPVVEPIALKEARVSAGLFSVDLDFGPEPFNGQPLWLEIAVDDRPLSPRTQLTAAPMAVHALTVADGSVTSSKLASSSVTGDRIAAGQVVRSINSLKDNVTLSAGAGISIIPSGNALTLSATAPVGWSLAGNAGTIAGTSFLGTTDNQALEMKVNTARALRLEPTASWPNIIGGYNTNRVSAGARGASIGGGAHNVVSDHGGVIGGGVNNWAGGADLDFSSYGTVGGGVDNRAVGAGSTVSGGDGNEASGPVTTISGGYHNRAAGFYATVAGGFSNSAQAAHSFAAGTRAKALHQGCFVWGDSTEADFASTADDQFLIRASGNVGIGTPAPQEKLSVAGSIKVDQNDSNDGTFGSGGLIKFGKGLTGEGIGSKRTIGGNWAGIDFYTGSSIKMSIANGGNVGIGTTSPSYKLDVSGTLRCTTLTQSSDIRLKTDIRPLSNSLGSVMRLRGVSFDWKDGSFPEGRQIGVIAQEVEAVFPELVSKDDEGYESVAYDKLVPVLIEAVKEQQEQMDAKDARISDLEKRLDRLERLLAADD